MHVPSLIHGEELHIPWSSTVNSNNTSENNDRGRNLFYHGLLRHEKNSKQEKIESCGKPIVKGPYKISFL